MTNVRREMPLCSKTYGLPLYCSAWVPLDRIAAAAEAENTSPAPSPTKGSQLVLALGGGGGEGRSSVPNAVLLSLFDLASRSLSDQPVHRVGTEGEVPYTREAMALFARFLRVAGGLNWTSQRAGKSKK